MTEDLKTELREIVWVDSRRMSGTPCFRGTRVPVSLLLDDLRGGSTIEGFLEGCPTVRREQVVDFLALAPAVLDEVFSGLYDFHPAGPVAR